MTTLTDYTIFGSWVLRSYKILTTILLCLQHFLAFVLQQKCFLSRFISTPPSKAVETSILAVGGWYWLMSQGLAVKCSVCHQVLQHEKEEILFRGPPRVTRCGVRCGISEGMALRRCENVKHGMCRAWARLTSYIKTLSSSLYTGHTWFTPDRKALCDR